MNEDSAKIILGSIIHCDNSLIDREPDLEQILISPIDKFVCERIRKLHADGKAVDIAILKDACQGSMDIPLDYWFSLDASPTGAISFFDDHVGKLREEHTKLKLWDLGNELQQKARKINRFNYLESLEALKKRFNEILSSSNGQAKDSFLKYAAVDVENFLQEDIPPPVPLLAPLLYKSQYIGIIGPRGFGKTRLAQAIALTLTRDAGKVSIGPWISENTPIPLLYIDAEMPEAQLQDNIKKSSICLPSQKAPFHLISTCRAVRLGGDENTYIDLLNPEHRQELTEYIKRYNFQVIIIDNLWSITPSWDNLDKEKFKIINSWCVSLRHLGKSIILLCHAGKNSKMGAMGPADIEFNMDCSIILSRPKDYTPSDLCCVQIEFHKPPRIFTSADSMEPFIFKIVPDGDGLTWRTGNINDDSDRVLSCLIIGGVLSGSEIAEKIGKTKGLVSQKKKALIEQGLIKKDKSITPAGREYIKGFNFSRYYQ